MRCDIVPNAYPRRTGLTPHDDASLVRGYDPQTSLGKHPSSSPFKSHSRRMSWVADRSTRSHSSLSKQRSRLTSLCFVTWILRPISWDIDGIRRDTKRPRSAPTWVTDRRGTHSAIQGSKVYPFQEQAHRIDGSESRGGDYDMKVKRRFIDVGTGWAALP